MQVKIARSAAELEQFRSAWVALFAAGSHTLFQRFEWNLLAAQVFGAYEQPYVILAEDANGAAIIPACIRTGAKTVSLLGEELFDYRNVLAAGDHSALAAAWEKLAELELPFEVSALRGELLPGHWAGMKAELYCHAPGATPARPPAPKNMLALRRLLRRGAVIERHTPQNTKLVTWIYQQKGSQGAPNLFADRLRCDFMEAVVQLPCSRCEIFTLELEGNVLAALVTFLDGECRRFYTTYFDERWAKSSPGFALLCEVSQQTLAQNLGCDFMTGEQSYKTRLASELTPLYRIPAQKIAQRIPTQAENLTAV